MVEVEQWQQKRSHLHPLGAHLAAEVVEATAPTSEDLHRPHPLEVVEATVPSLASWGPRPPAHAPRGDKVYRRPLNWITSSAANPSTQSTVGGSSKKKK